MNNPIIELTADQTTEFRDIWDSHKKLLHPNDYLFIKVKLGRPQAVLTKNQAYRMMMTLAKAGYTEPPVWLVEIFDPS